MQEIKNLTELQPYLNGIYKYIGLFTASAKPVLRFNSTPPGFKARAKEIQDHLESQRTPEAVYIIRLKPDNHKGSEVQDIYFTKGTPTSYQPMLSEPQDEKRHNFLSYDKALQYEKTIIELQVRVKELEKENADLNAELQDLEAEPETTEQAPQLSEAPAPTPALEWIKTLIPTGQAILEAFLEQKTAANELKKKELEARAAEAAAKAAPALSAEETAYLKAFLNTLKNTSNEPGSEG